MLEAVKIMGKAPELDGGVQQHHALPGFPSRGFDQYVVAQLGNINGYQWFRQLDLFEC